MRRAAVLAIIDDRRGSFPIESKDFGESAIEKSPPRRTSSAAVTANKLASRVILADAPTCAVLAWCNALEGESGVFGGLQGFQKSVTYGGVRDA